MKQLVQQVDTLLGRGEDLVLITIFSQSGSTPRLAGTKMIIRRDGRIHGTIGGAWSRPWPFRRPELASPTGNPGAGP